MNTFDIYFEKGVMTGREKGREEGREEGIMSGKAEVVRNLISTLGFTDEQVAKIANVSIDFVEKVRLSRDGK